MRDNDIKFNSKTKRENTTDPIKTKAETKVRYIIQLIHKQTKKWKYFVPMFLYLFFKNNCSLQRY